MWQVSHPAGQVDEVLWSTLHVTLAPALLVNVKLDPEQQACVDAPLGPLAIIAGPGAGKTRTIVARIESLVHRGDVAGDKVLALTHTTKAAGELKDRLARCGVFGVHVSTVHAMARKQILRFAPILDEHVPELASSTFGLVRDAARGVVGNVDTSVITELCGEIDWAAARLVPDGQYGTFADRAGRSISVDAPQVDEVRARYKRLKEKTGVIDFSDLLVRAVAQLEHDEVRSKVRDAFHAIFVDEYQDIDPLQQAVVDGWLDGRDVLTVCGDPDQGVFSFKGGDPQLLLTFSQRYPNATTVNLVRNYRSSAEIVSWVNRSAIHKTDLLVATNGAFGEMPEAIIVDHETTEERQLVEQLRAWKRNGTPWSEMAILYRYNSTAARLETALASGGVPYTLAGATKFFDRPEVRSVLVPFGQAARINPDDDGLSMLVDAAGDTGWHRDDVPEGMGAARQRYDAIAALVDLAADRYPNYSAQALLKALQERAKESHDVTVDGVVLATIHAAKGLEFDCVWVAGVVNGVMPSGFASTRQQLDEEQHLFYVAISRARKHLRVSAAERSHNKFKNRPSEYLDMVGVITKPSAATSGPKTKTKSSVSDTPKRVGRACANCGERLLGPYARSAGRCSGPCLQGDLRRRFDDLVSWRNRFAEANSMELRDVADDKALFGVAVNGSAEGVRGVRIDPSVIPSF